MGDRRIVLIADDDPDALEFVKALVQARGYETISAVDGREAIQKVTNLQPDMVLLDAMMPEVNGYSVCRQMKSNDLLRRIKVILYSAKDKEAGRASAEQAGADAFMPKPFEPADLWDTMKRLFEDQDKETAANLAKR